MGTNWVFYGVAVAGVARPLSTGAMFPTVATVQAYEEGNPSTEITLRLRVMEGRPVLVGISVGPDAEIDRLFDGPEIVELDGEYLRRLPFDELVMTATKAVARAFAAAAPAPYRRDPATEGDVAVRARGRRVMTDDLLADVVLIVKAHPEAPTRAVHEQMGCSYRTAGRWVAEARSAGSSSEVEGQKGQDKRGEGQPWQHVSQEVSASGGSRSRL